MRQHRYYKPRKRDFYDPMYYLPEPQGLSWAVGKLLLNILNAACAFAIWAVFSSYTGHF